MGICAGMILMANEVDDVRIKPLRLMPFKVSRNYYGRQAHSFSADTKLSFDQKPFYAPFIRAPGIERLTPEITVLAKHENNAVMIGAGNHIALSFHPELTGDTRIHEYWLRNLL
jgi:5'-phosphate synthase pdxT subunit